MRYIRYASIAIFGIALVTIALANRELVTLKVLPDELGSAAAVHPSLQVPLFAVIFVSIFVGLVLGLIWEFMIEQGKKAELKKQASEAAKLRAEIASLKAEKHKDANDVLALLDQAS